MTRRIPVFHPVVPRTLAGLVLAALALPAAARLQDAATPGAGVIAAFVLLAWLPSVWLTDKYRHKYPHRYDTYLLASHGKAAVVMAIATLAIKLVAGHAAPARILWAAYGLFTLADYLLSLPRRRAPDVAAAGTPKAAAAKTPPPALEPVDTAAIQAAAASRVSPALAEFLRANLPENRGGLATVSVVADVTAESGAPVALLVGTTRLNDVDRLNRFIGWCAERTAMGGYLAVSYTPLSMVLDELRRRYPGPLYWPAYLAHFFWYRALPKTPWVEHLYFARPLKWLDRLLLKAQKRRNRALPKAEAWGRLAFWGFEVIAEQPSGDETLVLAQRVSAPVANRKPSFFAVVALEKVGLDGTTIRLHKVRSMYPFSEFLQRRIHQEHGLTATGKFKDDFRLTEYGKLIRRHWIDEVPGLFDWMRGDIKLVGMRATSPAFLSTYPRELYDLYTQVKPGLIPPIFDENTKGFEQIVQVELTYLKRYNAAPIRTDLAYFWYTFRDIVFRKVRSH